MILTSQINHRSGLAFGRYRIDAARRKLWLDGEEQSVQPRVFDVIAYLIEHRDRAVGRDELISGVWGKTDVNDNVLSQIIARARRAIGDSADEQHSIQTVAHFGYVWIAPLFDKPAPVSAPDAPGPEADPDGQGQDPVSPEMVEPDMIPGERSRPGWWLPASLLSLLVLLSLIGYLFFPRALEPMAAGARMEGETALVLPVQVDAADAPSWVRLGLMDLVADRLRAAGQPVIPSDNTVALAGTMTDPSRPSQPELAGLAEIAPLILTVQAQPVEDRWRISIQIRHGRPHELVASHESDDILAAARLAADGMVVLLGHQPAQPVVATGMAANVDLVIQEVRAAALAGRFADAERLLKASGLAVPGTDIRLDYWRARISMETGDYDLAESEFRRVVDESSRVDEPLIHALAMHGLAGTLHRRYFPEQALPYFEQAIEALERQGSFDARFALGHALMGKAEVERVLNDHDGAQADFARARVILENSGDQLALAKLDANLSLLLIDRNRYVEAMPLAQRAARRIQRFGDVQSEIRARLILTIIHSNLLDAPAALAEIDEIDQLLARIDNPALADVVDTYRIDVLIQNGLLARADTLLARQMSVTPAATTERRSSWPEGAMASQALARGDAADAEHFAAIALRRPWDTAMVGVQSKSWLTLVRAKIALGTAAQAAQTVAEAVGWAEKMNNPLVDLYVTLAEAEFEAAAGAPEAAEALFQKSLVLADQRSTPVEILQVCESYAGWLIERGELDQASLVVGRVAGWFDSHYRAALLQLRLQHALGQVPAWRHALDRTRRLAGERRIPSELAQPPTGVTGSG